MVNIISKESTPSAEGDVPTAAELLKAQSLEASFMHSTILFGTPGKVLDVNLDGFVVRRSQLDGVRQVLMPVGLQKRLLYMNDDSLIAGHPSACRMYDTMRQQFYYSHMVNHAYAYVLNCPSCIKNSVTKYFHDNNFALAPA